MPTSVGEVNLLIKGIGVVNLVHSDGTGTDYYPIDYRIYAPNYDGKTKNDHFREMLLTALADKGLQAHAILFDSWYASVDNLKLIERLGRYFVTTLKSNRMVSLSPETGYVHLDQLEWQAGELANGQLVKLKELPFKVRLFKLVAPDGATLWMITNRPGSIGTDFIQNENAVRWQIE